MHARIPLRQDPIFEWLLTEIDRWTEAEQVNLMSFWSGVAAIPVAGAPRVFFVGSFCFFRRGRLLFLLSSSSSLIVVVVVAVVMVILWCGCGDGGDGGGSGGSGGGGYGDFVVWLW